jgi:DNA polymerase-4
VRKIIHIDMDAFFAAVEQRDDPSLRGQPVAVGGGGLRGVVASASYEARSFGVRSAMSGIHARRLCPSLIFVKPHFEKYREVSRQIREIFYAYTDLVEPLSLDEAYLDVTENKPGIASAMRIAMNIRQEIEAQTGLTASAGVSFNKFLAKVASDINKPNGMKVILPEEAEAFMDTLPIRKFHGIGEVTADKMHRMGIRTGADLRRFEHLELVRRFGRSGDYYYRIVRGEDRRQVRPNRVRKSIGAERTFAEDLQQLGALQERLVGIVGILFRHMQQHQNFGRTLTLKMKTADFHIYTRSKTFQSELKEELQLQEQASELLQQNWPEGLPIRLLGVSVSNLQREQEGEGIQLELFD